MTNRFRRAALVAYRALSDLAGKGSFFIITVAAAHRLSGRDFGLFSLASTLGWLAAVATDFGIQMHLARTIARDRAGAEATLRRWLSVRLALAAAAVIALGAGIAVAGARPFAMPLFLFTLAYIVSSLVEFLHYFYRALDRSDVESTLTLVQRLTMLACALTALWWRPALTPLALAMLLPVAATFALSLLLARRLGREAAGAAAPSAGEAAVPLARQLVRDVLPIGGGIVLSALYFRVDVFLVELWSGPSAVGLYNAVFRLVDALRLFPAAVLAVALPTLCRATTVRPVAIVAASVTAGAVAATAGLSLLAAPLVPLVYGAPYAAAVPAFRILLLAFPLMALNYALTHQLIGWDRQRAYAALCGGALVINVALNAQLIPAWSIEGAAWATVATEAFLTIGCLAVLWQHTFEREPRSVAATAL